jgi:hypothetical protein
MDSSVDFRSNEYGESTTSELVSLHGGFLIMQAYCRVVLGFACRLPFLGYLGGSLEDIR